MSRNQDLSRNRALIIMQVRSGQITATEGAKRLGISRKTYYKWEQRGLRALLDGLSDQSPGRPSQPVDTRSQELEKELTHVRRDNELLKQ